MLPDEYFDSIIKWHETRYGTEGLTKECIGYENGVRVFSMVEPAVVVSAELRMVYMT